MKHLLITLLFVACGGKSAPPSPGTPVTPPPGGSGAPAEATCKSDADCGEGKKCNECGPNDCQKTAGPDTMCPAVCGPAICVPAT